MVSDMKIFKDFKKFSVLLPWQPELLQESNYFKKSEEDHDRNMPVKFHQNLISSFREEDVLKKKLTHRRTDGQRAMTKARWPSASGAKNEISDGDT